MRHLSYKTKFAKKETHQPEWFIVDVAGVTVGRACAKIASVLRGKHKPTYTPHMDAGDFVIVINSSQVTFSGNKWEDKKYITYSGYPGGQKSEIAKHLLQRAPERIIEKAVKGMLPKNKLGRKMYKKVFVYANDAHPHAAQKPTVLETKKAVK